MASSTTSSKELTKAISAFFVDPALPLPGDLRDSITSYLEQFPEYDDAAAETLQEELLAIFDEHVRGNFTAMGPWMSILRLLLPMIHTPERIVHWLDNLKGNLTSGVQHDRGVLNETVAALRGIVAIAGQYQDRAEGDEHTNPIIHRLLRTWLERIYPAFVAGVPGIEYNDRLFRESMTQFGKSRPEPFFASIDIFLLQSKHRKAILRFLCDFLQERPPQVHQIMKVPLFEHLLMCLQEDMSTDVMSTALTALVMLLPHLASSLVPHLPVLFNVYARALFWTELKNKASELAEAETGSTSEDADDSGEEGWDVCMGEPDVDDTTVAHLPSYFTILYGLYPLSFMEYLRKPHRYLHLTSSTGAAHFDVSPAELRLKSERYRRQHLLHPNFFTMTAETEKTDQERWVKTDPAEVVAECLALCLTSDAAGPGTSQWDRMMLPVSVESPKEEPRTGPSNRTLVPEKNSTLGRAQSLTSFQALTRQVSHSSMATMHRDLSEARSHESLSDSQGLVQSPSNSQLQDLIMSNKVAKSSLQKTAADADDSRSPAPAEGHGSAKDEPAGTGGQRTVFPDTPYPLDDPDTTPKEVRLQRQNLMLQNDLSFERYLKQQHMAHISELRRRQVVEAATEAETQHLVMMNRNLKSRFEEAKNAEMQVRNEAERSRAMAKKWEADLSAKLKVLRDQAKESKRELDDALQELNSAKQERETLRKLLCAEEVKGLNWKQNVESAELMRSEMNRLRNEVSRLKVIESQMDKWQNERAAALEAASDAESKTEELIAKAAAHEMELRRSQKLFEAQVLELQSKLRDAYSRGGTDDANGNTPRANNRKRELEKMMAGSRSRQEEMQKQYDMLMRKYTVLQSSLLDMQSGATPEQIRMESSSVPLTGGDFNTPRPATTSGSMPNRPKTRARELSNTDPWATSYNVTPPLREQQPEGAAPGAGQRPGTPGGVDAAGLPLSPEQRYHGRGGVQNRPRKDGKGKGKDEEGKKERKTGLRGIRNGVEEFVRGRTE